MDGQGPILPAMISARFLPQKKYVLITVVSVIVLLVLYTGSIKRGIR